MSTRYVILSRDEAQHREHLAGPRLMLALDALDNDLRAIVKHDAWPDDAGRRGDVGDLVDWMRQRLREAAGEAGLGEL